MKKAERKSTFNNKLAEKYSGYFPECGCDEAGRGCLAGPVVAAAVILPDGFVCDALNDSKQLSEKMRIKIREIIEKEAVSWSVAYVDEKEIDKINILNASILAMHKAISGLKERPKFIIVDGNKFKNFENIPHETIVKGDGKYLSIAAASVLAKTYRDEYMEKIHQEFPQYKWNKNKAYPTKEHRKAILETGVSPYHRMSYRLLKENELPLEF
ncbi:MAG: ribonuclease HII [Porphyromonadaceae bacterium]|jgi:ribonuclease HII|nr:ribonuclease HII [Porphyromonadaceae bacterium]